MAGGFATVVGVSAGTGVEFIGSDDTLLQEDESLGGFEGRSRGIHGHDGSVEEGLGGVFLQHGVVLSTFTAHQQVGIVAGRAGQA